MSPSEQRERLSSLISDINHRQGEGVALAAKNEAAHLSVEHALFLLSLVSSGCEGVDADSVLDLDGLGYTEVEQVLAVSRLVERDGHEKTVPVIVSLGLSQARSEALLRVAPSGLLLLTLSDDKPWRRAMRGLPEADLLEYVESSPSHAALWMAVVSAQDGYMAKRVSEFRRAGRAYVAWIISGHSLAALEAQVPDSGSSRALTRLEVQRAVRFLDREGEPGSERE